MRFEDGESRALAWVCVVAACVVWGSGCWAKSEKEKDVTYKDEALQYGEAVAIPYAKSPPCHPPHVDAPYGVVGLDQYPLELCHDYGCRTFMLSRDEADFLIDWEEM